MWSKASHRASQVIDGIRSKFKNDSREKALLDVNEVIREVIALLRSELQNRNWVVTEANGESSIGYSSLDVLERLLAVREGKIALQIHTACGQNNSVEWFAAHPGATMEDFEQALRDQSRRTRG